jgi:membrane protein
MSKYNAIYGSFAALPLFLIWMQSSWLIVLLGAELSFSHQNEKSYEFETDTHNMSYHYRRLVSLLVVKKIVDHFKNEEPAPTMTELSVALKLPSRLVSELLRKLEDAGIIVEIIPSQGERQIAYGPAFDIDKMTVSCIVGKLDKHGTSDFSF